MDKSITENPPTSVTLTGDSPVGLTAAPYEQFEEKMDADLVRVLQATVWEVVAAQQKWQRVIGAH
jgi:hypothetical protein